MVRSSKRKKPPSSAKPFSTPTSNKPCTKGSRPPRVLCATLAAALFGDDSLGGNRGAWAGCNTRQGEYAATHCDARHGDRGGQGQPQDLGRGRDGRDGGAGKGGQAGFQGPKGAKDGRSGGGGWQHGEQRHSAPVAPQGGQTRAAAHGSSAAACNGADQRCHHGYRQTQQGRPHPQLGWFNLHKQGSQPLNARAQPPHLPPPLQLQQQPQQLQPPTGLKALLQTAMAAAPKRRGGRGKRQGAQQGKGQGGGGGGISKGNGLQRGKQGRAAQANSRGQGKRQGQGQGQGQRQGQDGGRSGGGRGSNGAEEGWGETLGRDQVGVKGGINSRGDDSRRAYDSRGGTSRRDGDGRGDESRGGDHMDKGGRSIRDRGVQGAPASRTADPWEGRTDGTSFRGSSKLNAAGPAAFAFACPRPYSECPQWPAWRANLAPLQVLQQANPQEPSHACPPPHTAGPQWRANLAPLQRVDLGGTAVACPPPDTANPQWRAIMLQQPNPEAAGPSLACQAVAPLANASAAAGNHDALHQAPACAAALPAQAQAFLPSSAAGAPLSSQAADGLVVSERLAPPAPGVSAPNGSIPGSEPAAAGVPDTAASPTPAAAAYSGPDSPSQPPLPPPSSLPSGSTTPADARQCAPRLPPAPFPPSQESAQAAAPAAPAAHVTTAIAATAPAPPPLPLTPQPPPLPTSPYMGQARQTLDISPLPPPPPPPPLPPPLQPCIPTWVGGIGVAAPADRGTAAAGLGLGPGRIGSMHSTLAPGLTAPGCEELEEGELEEGEVECCASAENEACEALAAAEHLQWRAAAVASDRSGRGPIAAEAATPAGAAGQAADLAAHLSGLSLGRRASKGQSTGAAAGKLGAAPGGGKEAGSGSDKGTNILWDSVRGVPYPYGDVRCQQDQGLQGWQGPAACRGDEDAAAGCATWQAEGATAHWSHPEYGLQYGQEHGSQYEQQYVQQYGQQYGHYYGHQHGQQLQYGEQYAQWTAPYAGPQIYGTDGAYHHQGRVQQGEPQLQRVSQQHCGGYQLQHNDQGWGPGQDPQSLQQQGMWAVSGSWRNGQQQQGAPPHRLPSDGTRRVGLLLMAFDTNVYLHHLQLVRACLQRLRTAQEGRILLPKAVERELDSIKRNPWLGYSARQATTLLEEAQAGAAGMVGARDGNLQTLTGAGAMGAAAAGRGNLGSATVGSGSIQGAVAVTGARTGAGAGAGAAMGGAAGREGSKQAVRAGSTEPVGVETAGGAQPMAGNCEADGGQGRTVLAVRRGWDVRPTAGSEGGDAEYKAGASRKQTSADGCEGSYPRAAAHVERRGWDASSPEGDKESALPLLRMQHEGEVGRSGQVQAMQDVWRQALFGGSGHDDGFLRQYGQHYGGAAARQLSRELEQRLRGISRWGADGDEGIVQCVEFFQDRGDTVVLVSEDRLLRLRARQSGVPAVGCGDVQGWAAGADAWWAPTSCKPKAG